MYNNGKKDNSRLLRNKLEKVSSCAEKRLGLVKGVDVNKFALDISRIYPLGSAFDNKLVAEYELECPRNVERRRMIISSAESSMVLQAQPQKSVQTSKGPLTAFKGFRRNTMTPGVIEVQRPTSKPEGTLLKHPENKLKLDARPVAVIEISRIKENYFHAEAAKTRIQIESLYQKIRGQEVVGLTATTKTAESENKTKESYTGPVTPSNTTAPTTAIVPDSCMRVFKIPANMRSQKELETVASALKNLKALASCAHQIIVKLCGVCRVETHYGVVFSQGDEPFSWYIILDGAVDIFIKPKVIQVIGDTSAKPPPPPVDCDANLGKKIVTLKAGQGFGELALVNNNPRSATVKCAGEYVVLLVIDAEDYQRTVRSAHQLEIAEKCNFLMSVHRLYVESRDQALAIASFLKWSQVAHDTLILNQGDTLQSFYVVKCGHVNIYRTLQLEDSHHALHGNAQDTTVHVRVARKGPGEYFGEEWIVNSTRKELLTSSPSLAEHESLRADPQKTLAEFPSLVIAKADGDVHLGTISVMDGQTHLTKLVHMAEYHLWDKQALQQLWSVDQQRQCWQHIRRRVIRISRLYSHKCSANVSAKSPRK